MNATQTNLRLFASYLEFFALFIRTHSLRMHFPCMAYESQMKVQPPQYTRQPQSQPINDISKEKSICLAFCRGKICKIQVFDTTLPHH